MIKKTIFLISKYGFFKNPSRGGTCVLPNI